MSTKRIRLSLHLLRAEMLVTSVTFAMPILNVFFAKEIGMSLAEVGLSQAIFTAALLVLNVPTGWLADRFSRRAANMLGDAMSAAGFAYYAFAHSFTDVVIAEIILGVGSALSGGADIGLLRAYCQRLGLNYEKEFARMSSWLYIVQLVAVGLGGVIGAYDARLAIGLSAVTSGVGIVLSLGMKEIGERRQCQTNPLRDMARIAKYALHGHKKLAWSIFAFAIGRESTHPTIWILTPLLLLAGVPIQIVGFAWAFNALAGWLGSRLARQYAGRMRDWQCIVTGAAIFVVSASVLSVNVSLATIAFYAGFGLAQGWFKASLIPIVQQNTPDDIQSTVSSVAASIATMLYIPLVWGLNALGDSSLQLSVFCTLLVFAPLFALAIVQLRRFAGVPVLVELR